MTTALDIITSALVLIGVQDHNETPASSDAEQGVYVLNRMLTRWQRDGVGIPFVLLASSADTIVCPIETHEAIEYNLALKLAPRYSVQPRADVVGMAMDGYKAVLRDSTGWVHADLESMPGTCEAFDISTR